jgi:hypothetical protein
MRVRDACVCMRVGVLGSRGAGPLRVCVPELGVLPEEIDTSSRRGSVAPQAVPARRASIAPSAGASLSDRRGSVAAPLLGPGEGCIALPTDPNVSPAGDHPPVPVVYGAASSVQQPAAGSLDPSLRHAPNTSYMPGMVRAWPRTTSMSMDGPGHALGVQAELTSRTLSTPSGALPSWELESARLAKASQDAADSPKKPMSAKDVCAIFCGVCECDFVQSVPIL